MNGHDCPRNNVLDALAKELRRDFDANEYVIIMVDDHCAVHTSPSTLARAVASLRQLADELESEAKALPVRETSTHDEPS